MENISRYKNCSDPLLRAAYWLAEYSWNNNVEFERLQVLSSQMEQLSSLLKIQEEREKDLKQQNAALVEALEDWNDMFEWGDFTIDFSNGVTCNGIDEGDVKGGAMLKDMIEKTKQALAQAEANKTG